MKHLEWPGNTRQFALLGVVLLVVTAGCAGLGSPDETGNDTMDTGGPEDPGDGSGSADGDENVFGDLDPVEGDVTAAELLNDSAGALGTVESYRLEQNITTVQRSNNQEITTRSDQTARFDRAQQRAAVEGVIESQSRTVNTKRYLLNDSIYESSEQIAQRFGTQWLRTNLTGSFGQVFRGFDSVTQLEQMFGNATGTVEGQTEIDGETVYAISATVDGDMLIESRQSVTGVERFQLNIWLSTETNLPVQVAQDSELSISTARGNYTQQTDSLLGFSYEEVDITLPEAAKDAPMAEEVTGQ